MAILHKKEEKIQAVLGRLPKKYTNEEFVAMFIKLYSKDWGKIKAAYIKQSQDKEPGKIINMPKPDLYLKQVLDIYLNKKAPEVVELVEEKAPVAKASSSKTKKAVSEIETAAPIVKAATSKAKKEIAETKKESPVAKVVTSKAKKAVTADVETNTPATKVTASKAKKVAEVPAVKAPVKKKTSTKKED